MELSDYIGIIGVFLILLAYFLHLLGMLKTKSYSYLVINLIGAGLACYASILIHYWPFVVLEAIWALVSLLGIVKLKIGKSK